MGPVIFVGPTLRTAQVLARLPDAVVRPPARQGDVLRVVRDEGAGVIGLIDGAFLDVPAVWHREILWALERGVRVVGAASMGALRAAELHVFGMEGVGVVFEAYRDGVLPGWDGAFEDDDEVAVVHAPDALGHAALSDAMVDIRVTLARAEAACGLARAGRDRLAAAMKALHFPERSIGRLRALAVAGGEAGLAGWLEAGHASQKEADGLALLDVIASGAAVVRPGFRMERSLVWTRFLAASAGVSAVEAGVLARLRNDAVQYRLAARAAIGRLCAMDDADGEVRAALGAFRSVHGLSTRAALVEWAARNDLNEAGLARLVLTEAAVDSRVAGAGGAAWDRALLDAVRVSGAYPDRKSVV